MKGKGKKMEKKNKKKMLWKIFISTLYLSAFTFGGGYVIVTLMKKKFVDDYHWIEENEMLDLVAIAQSSPGAIAVNGAIVVGYKLAGILGTIVAIIGTVIPPFLIISIISFCYNAFRSNYFVSQMLEGMQAGVGAVIASVSYEMGAGIISKKDVVSVLIMIGAFIAACIFNINVIFIVIISGIIGIIRTWINQILGTNYSFRKRFNLWENVVWYIENEKCEEMHISMKELFELIPKNLRYAAGGTELADLLWVINGTSSLLPRDLDSDSYAYDVWKCQRAIQEIFIKDLEDEEEKILSLLQMPRNRRRSVMDPVMKQLAKFTLFLPARIVLFLYTEFTGDNFWEIWSAIKRNVYHDEKMKKYASKELELYRKIFIEGPIAPVTTSDFLRQEGYFTFWETPPELGGEENYYISDWDRLYCWGKIEDVEITEEIDTWLNMLVKEYEMILKGKEQETENAFVGHIFNTMEYLNTFYGRIYLFKEFYNELLNNSHEMRFQAILDLLDKFGEKNKEIGRVYQKYGNKEWCMLSKNLKCNRGRMEIKRIIGVMANKELRKKYFGF